MNNNFENILEGKNLFVEKIVDKKYLKEKESLFNKAFNFHKEGNLEKAIFFYKESINKGILDDRVFVNLGVIFQSYSRFDIAIKLYSKVIDLNPNSAVAFANLGLIYNEIGDLTKAEEFTKKSIQIDPKSSDYICNLGLIMIKLCRLDEAQQYFKKAIELNQNNLNAYLNLASLYNSKGENYNAKLMLEKIIELNPNDADSYSNLGFIYIALNQLSDAERVLNEAIRLDPNLVDAYINIAMMYFKIGKFDLSIESLHKSLEINPNNPKARYNLGSVYLEINKFDASKAQFLEAINLNPNYDSAFLNLGVVYRKEGDLKKSISCFNKCIKLNPRNKFAFYNLGLSYAKNGLDIDALESYSKALKIDNKFVEAIHNIGVLKEKIKEYDEALRYFNLALKINNGHFVSIGQKLKIERHICDWSSHKNILNWHKNNQIISKRIQPRDLMYLIDDPSTDLAVSRDLYEREFRRIPRYQIPKMKGKIHIGYFSADFREHPVSFLMARIFELHDRSKFKIYAYSFSSNKSDKMTQRIKESVDKFRDVKDYSDSEIVNFAHADGIDIAIDLMGYTGDARPSIFSLRSAPVQINYLGFSGTTGNDMMDFIIADKKLILKKEENFYSEKVIYMKNSAMCCDDTMTGFKKIRKKLNNNFPKDSFIFACFNNHFKVSPLEFDIWTDLLKEVPNSFLWLKVDNKFAKENIIKEARLRNLDLDKLIFADHVGFNEHLQRHSQADLFLDTFNYNAGSTSMISLMFGLPVLTLYGKSYHSRMSSSLLISIGLDYLVAYSKKEYKQKALDFAKNPDKIISLKKRLRQLIKTSDVFNSMAFTKEIEEIYSNLYKENIKPQIN